MALKRCVFAIFHPNISHQNGCPLLISAPLFGDVVFIKKHPEVQATDRSKVSNACTSHSSKRFLFQQFGNQIWWRKSIWKERWEKYGNFLQLSNFCFALEKCHELMVDMFLCRSSWPTGTFPITLWEGLLAIKKEPIIPAPGSNQETKASNLLAESRPWAGKAGEVTPSVEKSAIANIAHETATQQHQFPAPPWDHERAPDDSESRARTVDARRVRRWPVSRRKM